MGAYFDEILLPRVVKAMCAESWKDGRAAGGTHVPSLFQVMSLESYDDTMARIQTKADSSFGYGIEPHSTTPIFNHYDIGHFQLDGQSPIHWIASFNELLGLQVQETHRLPASKLMVVVGRRVHGQTVMAIWRDETCCRASEWAQQWSAVSDALSLDGVETIYVNGDVHDADPRIESLEAAFAAAQFQFEPV